MTKSRQVKLADCVNLLSGFAFKSQQFTDDSSDVALVKGENVSQGRVLWEISKRWPLADWEKLEKFQLSVGDVVIAMDRPWVPAGLKWCFIRDHDPKSLIVQRCCRLRASPSLMDQTFLRCVIGGPGFESYIKPITTGVNIPHISGRQILDYSFNLPDLATQRKIAGILSAYDDLIENNQRRIKILEEMAQSLYREWFVHFRFPGHESARFTASPLGQIPEGWEVKAMTEAVTVRPKVSIPKGGDIPFVTMGGLSENSMLITEIESRDTPTGARFQNGDTLFARITPCLENGKTGYVEFLPSDAAAACGSTEFIVLRSKTVCPQYVYLMARSDAFRDNAIKSMSGATGRQRVRDECFEQFFLAQPPEDLLASFESITRPQFELIHSLNRRNQILRQTRDLLLPKLLAGDSSVDRATSVC
jgi:type I restriction enzyme S subunit